MSEVNFQMEKQPLNSSLLLDGLASTYLTPDHARLMAALHAAADALVRYNVRVRLHSRNALAKLPELSSEKILKICRYFESFATWISPRGFEPASCTRLQFEHLFIKRALDFHRWHVSPEFIDTVEEGDFIEIYGADMVQIYRSLSFFEVSGYSLLDLSVFEWYTLWERPKLSVERISACIGTVVTKPTKLMKFDVPKHVLREIYDTGLTTPFVPRTSLAEFVNIGSVLDEDGAPVGFICTARGRVLSEGAEASGIEFL